MKYFILFYVLIASHCFAFAEKDNGSFLRINDHDEKAPQAQVSLAPNLSEAIQLLSEYIQIPSVSGQEAEAGNFLANFCRTNSLHVKVFSQEQDKYNFAASLYPLSLGKPNVILLNHIDVVAAGNSEKWSYPPFSGTVTEKEIIGRGAIDCKGLAVMQLMAILNFKALIGEEILPFNITMLSVSDEERGGAKGSSFIIDNYLEYLNPIVVMGEGGSGMRNILPKKPDEIVYGISIAEKTNLWLKLILEEKTYGHGASPGFSYANKSMIEALGRLNSKHARLKFNHANRLMFKEFGAAIGGLKGFVIKHANWIVFSPFVKSFIKKDPLYRSLLTNTVTITNLNNPPGAPNQIAPSSSAILDCRLLPGTKKKTFIKKVKKVLNEPQIEIEIIEEGPASISTRPDVFYQAMKQSLFTFHPDEVIHVVPMLFPATSDNGFFREAGIPAYGFMPSVVTKKEIEQVHSMDESISKKALNDGILIYTLFLQNLEEQFLQEKDINLEMITTND
ncbi:MAG: M20/M25/M40 family metallo-hydrolase [Cyclobacteriaceae bacterium]